MFHDLTIILQRFACVSLLPFCDDGWFARVLALPAVRVNEGGSLTQELIVDVRNN